MLLVSAQKDTGLVINKKQLPKGISETQIRIALAKQRVKQRIRDSIDNIRFRDSLKKAQDIYKKDFEQLNVILSKDKSGKYHEFRRKIDSINSEVKDIKLKNSLVKDVQKNYNSFFEQLLLKNGFDKQKGFNILGFNSPNVSYLKINAIAKSLVPLKNKTVSTKLNLELPFNFKNSRRTLTFYGNINEENFPMNFHSELNLDSGINSVRINSGVTNGFVSEDHYARAEIVYESELGYIIKKPKDITILNIILRIERKSDININVVPARFVELEDPFISTIISNSGISGGRFLSISTLDGRYDSSAYLYNEEIFNSDGTYTPYSFAEQLDNNSFYQLIYSNLPQSEEYLLIKFKSSLLFASGSPATFDTNIFLSDKIKEFKIEMLK
jgi:hypothetical protein